MINYSCEVVSGSRADLCSINEGSTLGEFDSLTGTYKFSSVDMKDIPAGEYTFKITGSVGTDGILSTHTTFKITLADPCPLASLTLKESPFADQSSWRREDSI